MSNIFLFNFSQWLRISTAPKFFLVVSSSTTKSFDSRHFSCSKNILATSQVLTKNILTWLTGHHFSPSFFSVLNLFDHRVALRRVAHAGWPRCAPSSRTSRFSGFSVSRRLLRVCRSLSVLGFSGPIRVSRLCDHVCVSRRCDHVSIASSSDAALRFERLPFFSFSGSVCPLIAIVWRACSM